MFSSMYIILYQMAFPPPFLWYILLISDASLFKSISSSFAAIHCIKMISCRCTYRWVDILLKNHNSLPSYAFCRESFLPPYPASHSSWPENIPKGSISKTAINIHQEEEQTTRIVAGFWGSRPQWRSTFITLYGSDPLLSSTKGRGIAIVCQDKDRRQWKSPQGGGLRLEA